MCYYNIGDRMEKKEIIEFAKSIDIECIGFCDINFEKSFIEILQKKRENHQLSGFEEENEIVRTDVKALMENAKTIISIALPYKTKEIDEEKPYLSKSSLGTDYHRVMKNKLEILCNFIYNSYGAECKCFCDTSPLPDREIAKMSGIGFYGKNNNIITREYGSFVFLGEILTELYIERDQPINLDCGACDLCIKACPVNAIEAPYLMNPKKCLSFLSQKKEMLTLEEISSLGNRVYGCDTCQNVCPNNEHKNFSTIEDFEPQSWNVNLDAKRILNMTNKEFKESFGKTSGGWRGKLNFQRNLINAIGNSRNKEYLEVLEEKKESKQEEKMNYYIDIAKKKLENI
jgi:epoxyqueuosine reductase